MNSNNFAAGTTFNSIRIESSGYTLNGNALSLNAGLIWDFVSGSSTVNLAVTLAQPQTFSVLQGAQGSFGGLGSVNNAGLALTVDVAAAGQMTMLGISGSGGLTKNGAGRLTLGTNTYVGITVLNAGLTSIGGTSGFGSASSAVAVNAAAELQFDAVSGTFTRPITLGGKLTFLNTSTTVSGGITLNGAARIIDATGVTPAINGVISGSGGLRKTGTGTLTLGGGIANTFTGGATVAAGTLRLAKTLNAVSLPGPVTIGDGAGTDILLYATGNQIGNAATVNLSGSSAQYQCSTFSDVIGSLRLTGGSVTGSGTLTIAETIQSFAAATTASVDVNLEPAASRFPLAAEDGAATIDLQISGEWNGASSQIVERAGPGTVMLAGNGTAQELQLLDGLTQIVRDWSGVSVVLDGGSLGGTGPAGDVTAVAGSKGGVSPGTSAGILECANFTGGPEVILTMEIGGTTAGTQHDQLLVTGSADPQDATLDLVLLPGFTPAPGQTFTLVDNRGGDAVLSAFRGLEESSTFEFAGTTAAITYKGGDGNDVVLTILNVNDTGTVRVWDGGGADANWMTPGNWNDDIAPVPGDSLLFPAGAAQLTNSNNFPGGTNFHRLTMATNCTLNGNSILLNAGLHRIPGTAGNVFFNVPIVLTGPQTFSNLDDFTVTFGAAASVNNSGFALTTDTVFGSGIQFGPLLGAGSLTAGGAGSTDLAVIPAMTGPVVVTGSADLRLQAASLGSVPSLSVSGVNAELQLQGAQAKTVTQPITLRGRIQSNIADHVLTGIITVPAGATGIFFPITGSLAVNNRIQGAGSVMSAGNGILKLQGTLANTFTGGFQLSQGTVQLGKPAGVTALPGPVTNHPGFPNTIAGTILWTASHQIADSASISRVANLNLAGFDDTIASATLRGGTVSTGAGTLTLTGGMTCEQGPFGAAPFP